MESHTRGNALIIGRFLHLPSLSNYDAKDKKYGAFNNFLAAQLMIAGGSEPIRKILMICDAFDMARGHSDPDTLKEVDMAEIRRMHAVAVALNYPTRSNEIVGIAWGFEQTDGNFDLYIAPWFTILERIKDGPPILTKTDFFRATKKLSNLGLQMLKNQFIEWAMPKASVAFGALASLVAPNVRLTARDMPTQQQMEQGAFKDSPWLQYGVESTQESPPPQEA